jgi:hypothetical protein
MQQILHSSQRRCAYYRRCYISLVILSIVFTDSMHIDQSLHTVSKNVGLFMTDKSPINELFNKTVPEKETPKNNYLCLFGPGDF